MFGASFFGQSYFGPSYWSEGGTGAPFSAGYFGGSFWGKSYYGDTYWPGGNDLSPPIPPTPVDDLVLLGGKAYSGRTNNYSYSSGYQKHRNELDALAKKIAEAEEFKKLSLEANAQEEINRLLLMRADLIRRITDDEETLIVLYSLPFIN